MVDRQCVVVFDMDGTLLGGDSFTRLIAGTLRGSPARLCVAALLAPICLLLAAHWSTRLHAERLVAWTAFAGRSRSGVATLLRRFAAEHAGEEAGRRIPTTLQRLREHRQVGDRVIIATACAEPLAKALCRALDLEDVEVVASAFVTHHWRLPQAVPARGQDKLTALIEAGVTLPVDHAYADSLTDLPLLRAARTPHLVRPRNRHLPLLPQALGPNSEILR